MSMPVAEGKSPFFSVVVPAYNRAHCIGACVASVLSQSYQDFELIVIDDGSKDDLNGALSVYSDDPRLKLLRQPNMGGGAARNKGIDVATGTYVALLDSDDEFLPNKLQCVHDSILRSDVEFLFSYASVDRGGGAISRRPARGPRPGERFDDYLFVHGGIAQTSTLVMRSKVAKEVRFDETLPKLQDVDFVLRLMWRGVTWKFIEQELVVWNDGPAPNRVGSSKQLLAVRRWLADCRPRLSRHAYNGFCVYYLNYEIGWSGPTEVLRNVLVAVLNHSVPIGRIVQSTLRSLIPQKWYRLMVNLVIRGIGRRMKL